jgi:hypothetical protein
MDVDAGRGALRREAEACGRIEAGEADAKRKDMQQLFGQRFGRMLQSLGERPTMAGALARVGRCYRAAKKRVRSIPSKVV